MMVTANDPVAFFYANAGVSYNPKTQTPEEGRTEGARKLADAERFASAAGLCFRWQHDDITSAEHEDTDSPYPLWLCTCYDEFGKVVGSLGGVDFGDNGQPWGDPYRRVVEAEIAMEVLD